MSESQTKLTTPPNNIDAEKALLGSILLNSNLMDEIADILRVEYFYELRNQVLYKVILSLWSDNHPVDAIHILKKLESTNIGDKLTEEDPIDQDFLVELVAKSTLSNSPESLVKLIKEQYLLRTVISAGDDLKNAALEAKTEAVEILDFAQKRLFEVSLENLDKNFIPISEILGGTFDRINEMFTNKVDVRGIPTGFTDIDKILGGLQKSDLIILAARPSMGKTAMMLEIVKRVALNSQLGLGVGVFSLEMSRDQLADRILASVSGVDSWKIRTGRFTESEDNNDFAKLGQAIGILDQAPIWIDDSGGLSILELRSKARRLKSKHNIGLIVIDYLQLMNGGSSRYGGNRVQEVSDISRGLKILARELEIPIIALSQLSRSVEGRDDKRPMLSDLRESGSIEQDADVVMFIHREEKYNPETKRKGLADILISKHRNGRTGMVELAWIDRLATFENLEGARITSRLNE